MGKNRNAFVWFLLVVVIVAGLGACQASAETVQEAVYRNLNWSAADSGFNEGGLCGFQALSGIAGVPLPNLPFEYEALGNYWPRVDMMNAAQYAYNLGFKDAAIDAAICSQRHNDPVHDLLIQNRDIVDDWFAN